jgi:hypothetical protein
MIRIAGLIILLGFPCFAEKVSFNKASNGTNPIIIPSGEHWKIISYSCTSNLEVFTNTNRTSRIGMLQSTADVIYGGEGIGGSASGITLIGPAVIWVPLALDSYYLAIEKTANNPTASSLISSTSVVIPSSAFGDVDVKLEQSADNVTWTECLPGTYNSSTVKRFFRLRAVEK